jgi:hypothetical protein
MINQPRQIQRRAEPVAVEVAARRWAPQVLNVWATGKENVDQAREIEGSDEAVGVEICLVRTIALAGVADLVAVGVGLIRIESRGAIVHIPADAIAILIVQWISGTVVAHVPDAVMVKVGLAGVINGWTVVAGIRDSVSIAFLLKGIERIGTIVAEVPNAITIRIGLVEVPDGWAVVEIPAYSVPVYVVLIIEWT